MCKDLTKFKNEIKQPSKDVMKAVDNLISAIRINENLCEEARAGMIEVITDLNIRMAAFGAANEILGTIHEVIKSRDDVRRN